MENHELIENVKNLIKRYKHPSYITNSGDEISIRCPYCGDSVKNLSSTHFYINLKPPFKFFCHKCNVQGILNSQTMQDIGIFNTEIAVQMVVENNRSNSSFYTGEKKIQRKDVLITPVENERSKKAVEYFNSRYSSSFTNEEISEKFRVVTDAESFFNENNIKPKANYNFSESIGFEISCLD